MLLHFTKMHGLGNDFMVVDMVTQSVRLPPEKIRRLADRRFGIGFDQMLIVEPPSDPDMDFRYRIFNADGSEVEQCGNGARCFAKFVRDKKLTGYDLIHVQTAGGNIELNILDNGEVQVDMGIPVLNPAAIPFKARQQEKKYVLHVDGQTLSISAVSMGNPHAVLQVDDVNRAPVERLGGLSKTTSVSLAAAMLVSCRSLTAMRLTCGYLSVAWEKPWPVVLEPALR